MKLRLALVVAAYLTACLLSPARAGEFAGVTLPDETMVEESTLVLNGMGPREATWLRIKVYVAGLYVKAKSSDADAIIQAELPKRLAFVFVRSVSRKRLMAEWDESLEANLGDDSGAFHDRVAMLYAWMPGDVSKGDEMALTYLPGKGVFVEIKGETKGVIPGADFARALFAIWLGATPPNQTLKAGLLGHR